MTFASRIDPAVRTAMLEERLAGLLTEGYQHELNREVAAAIGNTTGIAQADDALSIIQSAVDVVEQLLVETAG